jgi:stage V sporulation protein G
MSMKITEVRIYPADRAYSGYASITLDNCWMIRNLRIIRNDSGELYVAMPNKKQHDGSYREIAFPITAEARTIIEEAVLAAYRAIYGEQDHAHHDQI